MTIVRLSWQALFGRRRGIVLVLIPALLVALLAASSVLGPEIDDGSVVYLLAKPISRHVVAISKYATALAATIGLGALPLLVTGLVLDSSDPRRALAWAGGAALAGTAYTALFLGLAALTRHAVVVGLLFALLWEGLLGNLFEGIRWLAIGAWGRELSGAISPLVDGTSTGLAYALVAAVVVTAGSVWFTGDRLRSFTLRGDE